MTKDEFMKLYNQNRNSNGRRPPKDYFGTGDLVALPCNCGESCCHGWAAVDNNPEAITSHEKDNAIADELSNRNE